MKMSVAIRKQYSNLFVVTVLLLMAMPLFVTSQEFLTRLLDLTGISLVIQNYIIPIEVKFVIALLGFFKVEAIGDNRIIVLEQAGREVFRAQIIWSCIGWQSTLLVAVTLFTGFRGGFTRGSRLETVIIGLLGTFWVNIFRIVLIYLIGFRFGQLPAYLFHNVAGTFMTILWLFVFWWFSYRFVLEERRSVAVVGADPASAN